MDTLVECSWLVGVHLVVDSCGTTKVMGLVCHVARESLLGDMP